MGYTVKHYMSNDGYGATADPAQSSPLPNEQPQQIGLKRRTLTINRATGEETYGPEEDVPVEKIQPNKGGPF
jgi:hypothetical protein